MEKSIMQDEEWRDIPGYEGTYMVSNLGHIKSVKVNRCLHGKIVEIKRDRMMSLTDNGNGYLYVTLKGKNGARSNVYVHRAVAQAFIEKKPGKTVVNHKDYNKKNNCVENLEWCTTKENVLYSRERMCHPHNTPLSKTGERYIGMRYGKYRLHMSKPKRIDKLYETLKEAIETRDEIMRGLI